MGSYRDEQIAYGTAIHAVGPAYAEQFNKLTSKAWTFAGRFDRDVSDMPLPDFALTEKETGIVIGFHGSAHDKKVSCMPYFPDMPNGSEYGSRPLMRDWHVIVDDNVIKETPEAGVAWSRFTNPEDVSACAKRFVKLVWTPYLSYWPQIQKRIADRKAGFALRDEVAARLCVEFNGCISDNGRSSERKTVYFAGSLPDVDVYEGGHLHMSYAPGFTLFTLRAYFNAVLQQRTDNESV